MNIKQLSEIHYFYTHFLAKIRHINTSNIYRDKPENEKKNELYDWLTQHKADKTFGGNVRHEIFHMLDLVLSENIITLETKIGNLEYNCEKIRLELEDKTFTEQISIRKNRELSLSENA